MSSPGFRELGQFGHISGRHLESSSSDGHTWCPRTGQSSGQ